MYLAAGLGQRPVYRLGHMALNQQVRTVGVDTDPGKIRPVSDAAQPGVQFRQIKIGAEKTGNENDSRVIAAGRTKTVVNRGRVQQENLGSEQRFGPKRSVGFRVRLG